MVTVKGDEAVNNIHEICIEMSTIGANILIFHKLFDDVRHSTAIKAIVADQSLGRHCE